MKIKHLFVGMLALAAAAACQEIVPEPTLDVDKAEVSLTAKSGEATIKVKANNAWTATADADWVTVTPASGDATAEPVEVKVKAADNAATEARTATVTVKSAELTHTVAVTQAAAEAQTPEPEPEPAPAPEVDWTSEAVVSYDLPEGASEKRQVLKNIKYQFDDEYFYVKLEASKALFSEPATEYLGVFIYDVTNGSGDGYYGWWNGAAGNSEYEGEHVGVFTGTDLALTIGETPVAVEKEENGDVLAWTLFIPRSADANLALENPSFAFMTYVGWEPNGALPDKYDNMLQFTPAAEPEPEPGLEESDWAVVGSFTGSGWGWDPTAGLPLYVLDDEYFVLLGVELPAAAEFKFLQGGAWGGAEVGASMPVCEPNTIQVKGSGNIKVVDAGKYDLYLAADASKFYVMTEGKTPAEATEPTPVEVTYTVVGTIANQNWNNANPETLMAEEGNYFVAKNVQFVWGSTLYGGAEQIEFKVVETGTWNGYGEATGASFEANVEIPVTVGAQGNIIVKAPEGSYDVYLNKENSKVWVMEPGKKPGETPAEPLNLELTKVTLIQPNAAYDASGQPTEGYSSLTLQFATAGITTEVVNNGYYDETKMKGTGHTFNVDFYTTDGTLAAGTYNACATAGTILEGEFGVGYDVEFWGMQMVWGTNAVPYTSDVAGTAVKVTDGTIVVEKAGNTYTITVESSAVKAKYVGEIAFQQSEQPEPETPADPWATAATYVLEDWMFTDYPQYSALTELKAYADETNVYVRLKSTKTSDVAKLRICTADTNEGTQSVWYWEKTFFATELYKTSKFAVDADFNCSIEYNHVMIDLEPTVEGENVYWHMTLPRTSHEHLQADSVHLGFVSYGASGSESGFMPKVWGEMLKVTLP